MLTSKVAIVKRSNRPGVDLDYLFIQVMVEKPVATTKQNCGNMLAGVGQFAIEQGMIEARGDETTLTVYMENTDSLCDLTFPTPGGQVTYEGSAKIDGVPGTHAPVMTNFRGTEGSTCGALLPTGNLIDVVNGIAIRADVERLSYISPRYLGIRPAYDACITETLGVVPKQQDCADAEYTYQDGRLNRDYKALLATLEHDDSQAAIEAQRAWLRFRDKDCAARAGRFGSDAGPTTQSTCLMESTAHRAQQLEDWTNTVKRHPAR